MAKDPAVLFYTSDFLTGTILMTNEQKGMYITLLCLQHQKSILSEKDMLSVCKAYDEDVFNKFVKTDSGYYNERMQIEHNKRSNFCKSRRDSVLKGIENKANKKTKSVRKSYAKRMEDENEDVIKDLINIEFDYFWNLYNKKEGDKNACTKKWNSLKDEERDKIIKTLPSFLSKIKDKQFQPLPATYLNQKRWNDELPKESLNTIPQYFAS